MRCKIFSHILLLLLLPGLMGCYDARKASEQTRYPVDTIGFARYSWQMDSIFTRINHSEQREAAFYSGNKSVDGSIPWKVVISPHDDYAYAGTVYPAALRDVTANTVILIGVAHKARQLNLENQLIFDSHDTWMGPYGAVDVSDLREAIIRQLPPAHLQVNDSMHRMEHSLEALIPFLQYQNPDLEIVPILVPSMSYEQMNGKAIPLAEAIQRVTQEKQMMWGQDFAIVISNDAVHYGDDGWGGKNFALYGADSMGYQKALQHEREVIATLSEEITAEKIRQFCRFTVQEADFREYKWTWCGRYSVPFGLLTSFHLNHLQENAPLTGKLLEYSTSIEASRIQVEDIGMGVTAPANIRHWVGYAAIGYF